MTRSQRILCQHYKLIFTHSLKFSQRLLIQPFKPHQLRHHSSKPSPANMSPTDYSHIPTPAKCYVDFCIIPVGTASASVAQEVAEVQKLLKASGLNYTMHSAGTTVEGSWDEVMKVVGQAHSVVHQTGAVRVQTSMRAGTRTDKAQSAAQKVKRVEEILAKDGES